MAAGPLVLLGGLALLLLGGGRRSPEERAREALNSSNEAARRDGFVRPDDPRGRVVLPGVEDVTQTRGRDTSRATSSSPAVRSRDLCRIPPGGLALAGSDAPEVLTAWVMCQGRTRSEVQTLLDRIDARYRSSGEPEQIRLNDLRATVSDAMSRAQAQGTIVSGVIAPERFDPDAARRLGGPLSRRLAAMSTRTARRDDVRDFQLAAGLEGTGLYTPATQTALRYYGIRTAPSSALPGPAAYRPPTRARRS